MTANEPPETSQDPGRRTVDEIEADLQAKEDALLSWPVAEIFTSINGEGPKAGRLAAFIRFPQCNLSCSFCDTAWANAADCPTTTESLSDLVSFVSASGAECITLTGGEPLLQDNIDHLIRGLLAADPDWAIEIETNGATDLTTAAEARHAWAHRRAHALLGDDNGGVLSRLNRRNLFLRESSRVSFTMDWKLPSSDMEDYMLPENLKLLEPHDSIKFVAGTADDLDRALEIMHEYDLTDREGVFFSPVFGELEPADIVVFMKRNRLSKARVQLQLHKIIWPNEQKGV